MLDCSAHLVGSSKVIADLRLLRQDHGEQPEVHLVSGGSGLGAYSDVGQLDLGLLQVQLFPGLGHGGCYGMAAPLLGSAG